jgi:multidrug efflux pump subunit AcrB
VSISEPFIRRPVATTLLTLALAAAGALAFVNLPVASLPQVAYPTIVVSTSLPGASPETMASAVATPLERQFGRIAGITEMTSSSALGATSVVCNSISHATSTRLRVTCRPRSTLPAASSRQTCRATPRTER